MKRVLTLLALAIPLCGPALATDRNVPVYYPEEYERIGTFNGINPEDGFIVISDVAIPLGDSPRVYTPATQFETVRYLSAGMTIGIKPREHRSEPVTEIWVMP